MGGSCLGRRGGFVGQLGQCVAPCWREGLALPWEPVGHMGLSWEQPRAGKGDGQSCAGSSLPGSLWERS